MKCCIYERNIHAKKQIFLQNWQAFTVQKLHILLSKDCHVFEHWLILATDLNLPKATSANKNTHVLPVATKNCMTGLLYCVSKVYNIQFVVMFCSTSRASRSSRTAESPLSQGYERQRRRRACCLNNYLTSMFFVLYTTMSRDHNSKWTFAPTYHSRPRSSCLEADASWCPIYMYVDRFLAWLQMSPRSWLGNLTMTNFHSIPRPPLVTHLFDHPVRLPQGQKMAFIARMSVKKL